MSAPVLWQFRHSHYNEKVRWALDWKGIPHVRQSLVPGLHMARTLWLTGQRSVPVLQFEDETVSDSTRIIAALEKRYPERPLYPADEEARHRALTLEEFFDERLGPYVRRALFAELLEYPDYAAAMFSTGESAPLRWFYRTTFPGVRAVMRFDMGIDDAKAAHARQRIGEALDRLESELQPSGYLVGDRFTVADLTAVALLTPLIFPPQYPYPLPGPLPERVETFRSGFATRRAFQWADDVYRRHRGVSAETTATAA